MKSRPRQNMLTQNLAKSPAMQTTETAAAATIPADYWPAFFRNIDKYHHRRQCRRRPDWN